MKRTRNGILIPDVPIMAGGNLPNAVKGVSNVDKNRKWRHTGGYIEGDGFAFINMLVRQDVALNLDIFFVRGTLNIGQGVFGTSAIAAPNLQTLRSKRYSNQPGKYDFAWNGNFVLGNADYKSGTDKDVFRFRADDNTLSYENITKSIVEFELEKPLQGAFTAPENLLLFRSGDYIGNQRIYSVRLSKNDVVLRDMYPAIDDSGTVCMYDYVSNTFFYNQNSQGEFFASREVINA